MRFLSIENGLVEGSLERPPSRYDAEHTKRLRGAISRGGSRRAIKGLALLFLASLLLVPAAGQGETTSSSQSVLCSPVSCTLPAFREDVYAVSTSSLTIPPVCARSVAFYCVAGVQGDPDSAPGSGSGITVSVGTPAPGIWVKITLCNNKANQGVPAQHCPNTTRIVITVITPNDINPAVEVSRACAVVFAGDPVPCTDYP